MSRPPNRPRPPAKPEPSAGAEAPSDPLAGLAQRVGELSEENRQLFQRLLADERRFRALARGVWKVQEDERRRLAGELHDGIGQTLSAIKIGIERLAASAPPGRLASDLTELSALAGRALEETRHLSHLLRPRILDDLGVAPALNWLCRTLGKTTGIEVDLSITGLGDRRLGPELETLLFRVVQEALNNAIKHSGASCAEVRLALRPRRIVLRVVDAGRGFDPAAVEGRTGCGLAGLRDRVEVLGGKFALRSAPGEGTLVEVRLPLAAEGAASRPALEAGG